MSSEETDKDPSKKHRHDIGNPDHGPQAGESTTKTIQGLLGVCIALSVALVFYAIALAGTGGGTP